MPTANVSLPPTWTKVAATADANVLLTWRDAIDVEVATTAADAAPAADIVGHRFPQGTQVTRTLLGTGYVWAKALISGNPAVPTAIPVSVSK